MNEFAKKVLGQLKALWGKWSIMQRAILCGIAAAAVIGIIALFSVSATPTYVSVIDAPIQDEDARNRIVTRINQEGVRTNVTAGGLIQVPDEPTARRLRTILIREDLIPRGTDPWAIFDRERWTLTDFERNVNLRRAQTQMITDHVRAVDGVDNANVIIVWPERRLFGSEQNPVTASVSITPRPGSDISNNRSAIEGIQRLLQLAVEGLQTDNIVITDHVGTILNDFANMGRIDRLQVIEREQRQRHSLENRLRAELLSQLQGTFSPDRVRSVNVSIDMDMSVTTVEIDEIIPTVIRERTPGLPFDDSEIVPYLVLSLSESETRWRGTGLHPQGPPGVEGHVPPGYRDLANVYGEMIQQTRVHNHEMGRRRVQEERSPQVGRTTVSVNIDGTWRIVTDERGNPVVAEGSLQREFTPLPEEQRLAAEALVRNAIGFSAARGDSVTVQNIPFDRTAQFLEEDAAHFRRIQIERTVMVFLFGLVLLLVGFIVFRIIAREMERRRKFAEEERARREQALRESAMAEAEQDGLDVSISVADRDRMELMESVANLAKEHPEDCAALIRTWLLEE